MTPPHTAPRSVSRRWTTPGTANGARPAPASRRLWSIVARTTTGSPSASSRTAAGKNQSGRPAKVRSAHATPSTAEPLSAKNPSVRARGHSRAAGEGAGNAPVSASRAASSSSACWKRSAGRFSRQRWTIAPSCGGTAGRASASGAGAWVTWAAITACAVLPRNGGSPGRDETSRSTRISSSWRCRCMPMGSAAALPASGLWPTLHRLPASPEGDTLSRHRLIRRARTPTISR